MTGTYYSVTSKTKAYIGYTCSSCEYPMVRMVEVTGKGVGRTEREAEEKAKKNTIDILQDFCRQSTQIKAMRIFDSYYEYCPLCKQKEKWEKKRWQKKTQSAIFFFIR